MSTLVKSTLPPLADSAALPRGWAWCVLADLVDGFSNGFGRRGSGPGEPAIVLRLADVCDGNISLEATRKLKAMDDEISKYSLAPGDLLTIRVNGSPDLVGRFVRFECSDEPVLFCDHFIRFRPRDPILGSYIRLFGDTGAARDFIDQFKVSSAGQNTISQTTLGRLRLPLPPVAEQRRIVGKVEEVLARVNAARERLAKVPAILRRFRQAVLAAACSGRLTTDWRSAHKVSPVAGRIAQLLHERKRLFEGAQSLGGDRNGNGRRARYKDPYDAVAPDGEVLPDTWAWVSVSHLCFQDVGFAFKSAEFATQGVRLLRGENVEPGKLRWSDVRYWPTEKLGEFHSLLIEEGDLILAMDRPVISTGLKLARAKHDDLPCLLVQRVMRFRMVERETADYLHLCLMHPAFTSFLSHDGMTGSDLPHITGTGVAKYPVALPPIEEQREIVKRAAKLLALADRIEARVASARARADVLTQAVLAKAFRRELVETEAELARKEGREFETAEQLLARIRAARESSPVRPRSRSRRKRTTVE